MTVQEVVNEVRRITSDRNSQRFSDADILMVLNTILLKLGQELKLFKNTFEITLYNGQAEYEYDESILEILQMRSTGYEGNVISPTSLSDLPALGRVPPWGGNSDPASGLTLAFHDSSSYGKFKLDPAPQADAIDDAEHVWAP